MAKAGYRRKVCPCSDSSVLIPDTDGDGLDDFAAGFTGFRPDHGGQSGVYVFTDPSSGKTYADDVATGLILPETGDRATMIANEYGHTLASAGDVDGDGYGDILVGAPDAQLDGQSRGVAYVVSGPVSGDTELFFATARIAGTQDYGYVGRAVASTGDADGDGKDDIALGMIGEDRHGRQSGAVGLFVAPAGELDFEEYEAVMYGDAENWYAGYTLSAGDVTHDGTQHLAVGAVYANGADAGLVAVLPGGI